MQMYDAREGFTENTQTKCQSVYFVRRYDLSCTSCNTIYIYSSFLKKSKTFLRYFKCFIDKLTNIIYVHNTHVGIHFIYKRIGTAGSLYGDL